MAWMHGRDEMHRSWLGLEHTLICCTLQPLPGDLCRKVAAPVRMIRMMVMFRKFAAIATEVAGGASTDKTSVQHMQSTKSN